MERPRPIGPYLIEDRLAAGGMAEVYVAKRVGPHGFSKRVALKRILPQFVRDPNFVAMFIDEARLAARLAHPNIVQVFDFGDVDQELFLAMELVDGTNVNRLLRAASREGERVPLDIALHVVLQTARALRYAHGAADDEGKPLGFVHRDVSPANILLTRDGHVKLTDFGIATVKVRTRRTEDGHVRGKLGYMSPEQVLGQELTGKSDVFTLATVFAEMLLGEPLFGVGNDLDVLVRIRDVELAVLDRLGGEIPQDVRQLLQKGLARDPEERPDARIYADGCAEVIRRRGFGHGADRLARFLRRLDLIEGVGETHDPGSPLPTMVDVDGVGEDTGRLLGDVGVPAPPIYRVKVGEQMIGPVSLPTLVRMLASGEVSATTPVSKDQGELDVAATLPELSRFVKSRALSWDPEELEGATDSGGLAGAALLRAFYERVVEGSSGVLHLDDGSRRKKIYLVGGRPEFIASTDRRELLGEFLIATQRCLRMEVDMALALLPRYGGRLGDALVGLGVLRPVELVSAIAEQARGRLLEAFEWTDGRWAFVPDRASGEEVFPIGVDVYELMGAMAARIPTEELRYALSPHGKRLLRREESPLASALAYRPPIPWIECLERIDDRTSTQKTLEREKTLLGEEEAMRALVWGLSCGLIRAGG